MRPESEIRERKRVEETRNCPLDDPLMIMTDYQAYLQQLPVKDRSQVTDSSIHYFGNGIIPFTYVVLTVGSGFARVEKHGQET